ncbi:MAG: hypothetical protein Q4P34_04600 [Tissierellia bacterium]|nr:hypothetical protein [Tissierellia bacterium]
MNKKDIIKRALNEYSEDKARHYEELSKQEIKFSPDFDKKMKEQIERPGILNLLTPKTTKFIAIAAVFVVVIAAGSQIIPKLGKDNKTDEIVAEKDIRIEEKVSSKPDKEDKNIKKETGEKKKSEEKAIDESEEALEKIDDIDRDGNSEYKDESAKEAAMDDATIVKTADYSIALSKPIYAAKDEIEIYIKNISSENLITDSKFTIVDPTGDTFDYDIEEAEISIPQNSTRRMAINLNENFDNLKPGRYKLTKNINGQQIELQFELR